MAQSLMSYPELLNSFYLALEENQSYEELDSLEVELQEFGFSESETAKARSEASALFSKNCF